MDSFLEPEDQLRQRYLSAPWGDLGRSATLGIVSITFTHHVLDRAPDKGLITVCNHTSTVDDPMLLSAMLPWSFFLTEHTHGKVRWSLCARELCYSNPLFAQFFKSGKTLPIERGAGPDQPVMRVAAAELSRGGWIHLFPEGRINYTGQLGPLRWGIGKIFCDAVRATGNTPTVLPFYHSGMGRVMPRKSRLPRLGQEVQVTVGDPITMEDLALRCRNDEEDQTCVWKDIAARVGKALRELEERSPRNMDQVPGKEAEENARKSEGAMPQN